MIVTVNGEQRQLAAGATVATLVASLDVAPEARGIAIALNGEVVRRGSWQHTELLDGARVEVVSAVQGG
ncbi:MAG TPA: sulfur carrier protein ThiS [Solirubrobacteraceae bacterium]|nr:sulfur carrier protein ThiS [Solirubrobacteraceae bacterium]